ncbi:hypothetical protein PENTCL1PPCAC_20059, partial [Pristionchus entomophagus]
SFAEEQMQTANTVEERIYEPILDHVEPVNYDYYDPSDDKTIARLLNGSENIEVGYYPDNIGMVEETV